MDRWKGRRWHWLDRGMAFGGRERKRVVGFLSQLLCDGESRVAYMNYLSERQVLVSGVQVQGTMVKGDYRAWMPFLIAGGL
jgi:hypothetical protein